MTPIEARFVLELDMLRRDCEAASQHLYAFVRIDSVVRDQPAAAHAVQSHAAFWITVVAALDMATVITLGRVFDQESRTRHSVDILLRYAQRHSEELFSKSALYRRTHDPANPPPEWLNVRIDRAHVPTDDDFRRLRKHVRQERAVYQARYKDVRDKLLAHRGVIGDDIMPIIVKADIDEFKRLIGSLLSLHDALNGMLLAGLAPILRPRSLDEENNGLHAQVAAEAEAILRALARQFPGE